MVLTMQLIVFLYLLASVAGSDNIFKLVNSSVELDVQNKSYNFNMFTWIYKNKKYIVQKNANHSSTTFINYKMKAVFNETTHSLTLNNLQKSDSGLYEAEASNDEKEIVAKYKLYVLDPVKEPVLSVSRQQNNDTCNVILTCEAQNLLLNFSCQNGDCDNEDNKTSEFSLLSLNMRSGFIVCKHSNPVSSKNATMEIKHVKKLCSSKDEKTPVDSAKNVIIIVFGVIGGLLIVFIMYYCRKYNMTSESDNTIYEEVKGGNKNKLTTEMSEKNESPCTVYCTVGKPTQDYSNDESTVSTANPGNKVNANKESL